MATLTLNFRPASLDFSTDVNIYLPDNVTEDIPTLWLLHGMHGDRNSWMNGSAIVRHARARGIAVVMPSAENSFYTDQKYGFKYYTFIAKELPEYLRKILPLSKKREKNYIAGLSMGGYGAFKLALLNPDTYCAAASLSGCLDLPDVLSRHSWGNVAICNWGEDYATCVKDTTNDVLYLIDNFPKDPVRPRLYVACGTEDFLYEANKRARDHLEVSDFEFSYNEGPGAHTWGFWAKWILPAIEFMMKEE